MKSRFLTISALVGVVCLIVLGQASGVPSAIAATPESTAVATTNAATAATAIRFIHASPGTPALDAYIDNQLVAKNLAFGSAPDPVQIAPGQHDFALRPAGSAPDSEAFFAVSKATLGGPGQSVLLMLMGALDQSGEARFRVRLYGIDRTVSGGKARFQAIHASPDTPAIDVRAGTKNWISALGYPNGLKKPILVDPGTYDLRIFPLGGVLTVWGERKQQKIEADTSYVWVLIGNLGELKTLFFSEKADQPAPAATAAATEAATATK